MDWNVTKTSPCCQLRNVAAEFIRTRPCWKRSVRPRKLLLNQSISQRATGLKPSMPEKGLRSMNRMPMPLTSSRKILPFHPWKPINLSMTYGSSYRQNLIPPHSSIQSEGMARRSTKGNQADTHRYADCTLRCQGSTEERYPPLGTFFIQQGNEGSPNYRGAEQAPTP